MAMILDIPNLILGPNSDRMGEFLIKLKNALVARGWTVRGSGDGQSAFQNEGQTAGPFDVFTAPQPWINDGVSSFFQGGVNTISRSRAWFRIREPAPSTREFLFQRYFANNTTDAGQCWLYNLRMAVSGFTGGGAAFGTVPTASGLVANIYANGDTAAWSISPLTQSPNRMIAQVWISDQAQAGNVWPFYYAVFDNTNTGTNFQLAGLYYESLTDTDAADAHPFVFQAASGNTAQRAPAQVLTSMKLVRADGSQMDTSITATSLTPTYDSTQIPNPLDGKLRTTPIYVYDAANRWKGRTQHLLHNPSLRNYPHVSDLATSNARVHWGGLLVPWPQGVTPLT